MINVFRYDLAQKILWDSFIDISKNGTFMLKRDYVEYHSNRFIDFSLLFYEDNKLIGVMPGSLHGNEVHSHGGLTYGGIVMDFKMTTPKMLEVFIVLQKFLQSQGIKRLIYKKIPKIYEIYPSDEDLYALFINNAKLFRRDISTTLLIENKIPFNERRKRNIKKALKANLYVKESFDYIQYIDLLSKVLNGYHNTKPVHNADEINHLIKMFPENIKLFAAFCNNEMLAGVLIFEMQTVVHTQYMANSDKGRNLGALDLVIEYLVNTYAQNKRYFDFGISNENNGQFLNIGLVTQKQEFGGRGVIHDFYQMEIAI